MGTIWLRDFIGGLDNRRMAETSKPGVFIEAVDGHINRGGEFEVRPAFVPAYTLPASTTKGLFAGKTGLHVFGEDAVVGIPLGITYQRIRHLNLSSALVRVTSADLYAGKVYATAEFADGAEYHYYDGTRIAHWGEGRARMLITVSGSAGGRLTGLSVDGVQIIGGAVDWAFSSTRTAAAIADAINTFNSEPEFIAKVDGARIMVMAAVPGTASNGAVMASVTSGDIGLALSGPFASGHAVGDFTDARPRTTFTVTGSAGGSLTDLKVNSVDVIAAASIPWATSNNETAAAIAAAINSFESTPDYVATVEANVVTIYLSTEGTTGNGRTIAATVVPTFAITASGAFAGGINDPPNFYQAGSFAKTVGSKVYALSGPNLHFSGIEEPTLWNPATTGAGFIDLSKQAAGSEQLIALSEYQNFIAILAARTTQIWYIDPDPDLNRWSQTLKSTGTRSPRSVTQFGDSDIFYLDKSGTRSLRARDSSNAASTSDIGIPVDQFIIDKLNTLTSFQRAQVIGLIEPNDGRFWLIFRNVIYVFSFFAGSKVSAWSTYLPTTEVDGEQVAFEIEDACVFQEKVYVRGNDEVIYAFGGTGATPAYDSTEPVAQTAFLDGDQPAQQKQFNGVDAACVGSWEIRLAMQPTNSAVNDKVATVSQTTFNADKIPGQGSTTHFSLKVTGKGSGFKKISSAVIHYMAHEEED